MFFMPPLQSLRHAGDYKRTVQYGQFVSLQAAFRKFHGLYNDLIYPYNLSLGHMLSDIFHTNR
jgi:hypothetical protein